MYCMVRRLSHLARNSGQLIEVAKYKQGLPTCVIWAITTYVIWMITICYVDDYRMVYVGDYQLLFK